MATGEPTSNGDFLQREVNESKTQESNKRELDTMLRDVSVIKNTLGKVKPEVNASYENLRLATIGALRNLRIDTDFHLKEVQKSLTGEIDFTSLSEGDINNIELENIRVHYTEMIKMSLDLNQREALSALQSSNEGYKDSWTPSYIIHKNQESYITSILGENHPGYNQNFIQGFNDETVGNFLVTIPKFENILQGTPPEEWNSMALIHYFEKLHADGNFNLKTLTEKMGAAQIIALKKLWATQPNGPAMQYFTNNPELTWIVEKDIDYSTLLNSPERFRDIAKVFDALPEQEKESVKTQLFEYLTSLGSIEKMDMLTGDSNLGGVEDGIYKDVILKARAYYIGEAFAAQLRDIYAGGPDVGDILTAIIRVSAAGTGENFEFSGLNSIIQEYNKEHGTNYPEVSGSFGKLVEDTAKNLYDSSNLAENFHANLEKVKETQKKVSEIRIQIGEINEKIKNLQQEITQSSREGDISIRNIKKDELEELQFKKNSLERQLYYFARNLGDIQMIDASIAETQANLSAYKSSFESYNGINFQLNTNDPTDVKYILANPEERIGRLSNEDDVLKILVKIPADRNISIQSIPWNLRKSEKIIDFFIQRNFQEANVSQLPNETIKNPDIIVGIIKKYPSYTKEVLRSIERVFSDKQEALEFLIQIKEKNPDIFTPEVQKLFSKYMPYSIRILDVNKILQSDIPGENIIDNIEKAREAIVVISQKGNFDEKASAREALERYFDTYDISQYREILGELAKKEQLSGFPDALKKLGKSDGIMASNLIHDNPNIILSLPEDVIQHPAVMQEIGKQGLRYLNNISHYFNGPKVLANFLMGYFSMNHPSGALINNASIQSIKARIGLDEDHYISLTEEEKEALSKFKTLHEDAKLELEGYQSDWEKIKEQFDEKMILEIKNLLENMDDKISDEDREIIMEKFKTGKNDEGMVIIAEILKDGELIAKVNKEILEIIERKHRKLDETSGPELAGISSTEREQVEKAGLYDRENQSFDMLALEGKFENYINTQAKKISDINKLKDPAFLIMFLESLNIPEKILEQHQKEIIERLQNKIDLKIVEIAKKKHSETAYEDMGKLYSPEGGVFKSAEQEMVQDIQKGNFSLNSNAQNTTQTSSQTSNSQSQSGTYGNISYTLQYSPGKAAVLEIGGKEIDISPDEAKAMQKNPEVIKNFIDADSYFSKAGLESVWRNYRNEIVIAMNMSSTTGDMPLDLSDDSLRKDELIRFAKFAYKIIFGKDASPSNNPEDLQSQFTKYGNIYGEDASRFGDQFISDVTLKGIDRNKSSLSIASTFKSLAEGEGLQKTSSK